MAKDLLDFSKFKKIFSDEKNTHLQHPKGHTIIVAHVALSPKVKEQLDKLPIHNPKEMIERALEVANKVIETMPVHKAEGGEVEEPAVNRINMHFKDVTKRIPELTEAAKRVSAGEMDPMEYDTLVNKHKPVAPYKFIPAPATVEEATKALGSKSEHYGKTDVMSPGERADLRLDIPSYLRHGVWVNSIHREKDREPKTIYNSVSSVKNAQMIGSPNQAIKVAAGEINKSPFAVIRGDWNPISEKEAVVKAQKYLKHKDWRQVGYDPERHGYFYDRETMHPIESAEEVLQIGPLVLAKKPKYGKKEEQKFAEGGEVNKSKQEWYNMSYKEKKRHVESQLQKEKEDRLIAEGKLKPREEREKEIQSKIQEAIADLAARKKYAEGGEAKPFKGYNPEKHSRTGGLNDSYREKYNREHGSDLKRPVTGTPEPGSEAAGRKKSFCARMKGVKGPTSEGGELTPKGAALKRWNCHAHGGVIEDDHDEECMHYARGGEVEDFDFSESPDDKTLTSRGEPLPIKEGLKKPQWEWGPTPVLHTKKGSIPLRFPKKSDSTYQDILRSKELNEPHEEAMGRWLPRNKALQEGKPLSSRTVGLNNLMSILSANTATPQMELSFSRLLDASRKAGIDPRSPEFAEAIKPGGKVYKLWEKMDSPESFPEQGREYFEGPAREAFIQGAESEQTGRKAGDIVSTSPSRKTFAERLSHFPASIQYYTRLANKHGADAVAYAEELARDKAKAISYRNKVKRLEKQGKEVPEFEGDKGALSPVGLGTKTNLFAHEMSGAGNSMIPDTHILRSIFGLDVRNPGDAATLDHIKATLLRPQNYHLLKELNQHYQKEHPAHEYAAEKYGLGKGNPQATFPAHWLHWNTVAPYERAQGIGRPSTARNLTTHGNIFKALDEPQEYMAKGGQVPHYAFGTDDDGVSQEDFQMPEQPAQEPQRMPASEPPVQASTSEEPLFAPKMATERTEAPDWMYPSRYTQKPSEPAPEANPWEQEYNRNLELANKYVPGKALYAPTPEEREAQKEQWALDKTLKSKQEQDQKREQEQRAMQEVQSRQQNLQKDIEEKRRALGISMPGYRGPAGGPQTPQIDAEAPVKSYQPTSTQDVANNEIYKQMMKGFNEEIAGYYGEAKAKGEAARASAQVLEKNLATQRANAELYQEKYKENETLFKEVVNAYAAEKINPMQVWQDASVPAKISSAIGLILGGIGGGLMRQENPAMKFLQYQIDKGIEGQKMKLGREQNIMTAALNHFKDIKDASDFTRVALTEMITRELELEAARTGDAAAIAMAQQKAGALKRQNLVGPMMRLQFSSVLNDKNATPEMQGQALRDMEQFMPDDAARYRARYSPVYGMANKDIPLEEARRLTGLRTFKLAANHLLQKIDQYGGWKYIPANEKRVILQTKAAEMLTYLSKATGTEISDAKMHWLTEQTGDPVSFIDNLVNNQAALRTTLENLSDMQVGLLSDYYGEKKAINLVRRENLMNNSLRPAGMTETRSGGGDGINFKPMR